MKNSSIYYLVIIGIVLVALAITNPTLEKQKELLVKKMISDSEKVKKDLAEKQPDNALDQMANELGQQFLQPEFISNLVNNSLSRDNYLFFSLPRMTVMSKTKIIGIGFAGNVIWFDDKDKQVQNDSLGLAKQNEAPKVEIAKCIEEPTKYDEYNYGTTIVTCSYKNIKFVEEMFSDNAGRTRGSEIKIYKKKSNGDEIEIKKEELFNQNKQELLSVINTKLEKQFIELSKDPETDCFKDTPFKRQTFEELKINLVDSGFKFASFNYSNESCLWQRYTSVKFTFSEIQKYLNIDNLNQSSSSNSELAGKYKFSQLRGLLIGAQKNEMIKLLGQPNKTFGNLHFDVYIYNDVVLDDLTGELKSAAIFRNLDSEGLHKIDELQSGKKGETIKINAFNGYTF
jgi:hypothetical protein